MLGRLRELSSAIGESGKLSRRAAWDRFPVEKIMVDKVEDAIEPGMGREAALEVAKDMGPGVVTRYLTQEIHDQVSGAVEVLKSDEFAKLIDECKVTFGFVKPRLDEGLHPDYRGYDGMGDAEIEESLIEEFNNRGIEVVLAVSVNLQNEQVEEFYSEVIERLSGMEADDPTRYENKAEQFVDFMTSGPVTAMVLYREEGSAVGHWRDSIIGPTMPDVAREGDSDFTRARMADVANNGTHGSDSIKSVKREIGFLTKWLEEMVGV